MVHWRSEEEANLLDDMQPQAMTEWSECPGIASADPQDAENIAPPKSSLISSFL